MVHGCSSQLQGLAWKGSFPTSHRSQGNSMTALTLGWHVQPPKSNTSLQGETHGSTLRAVCRDGGHTVVVSPQPKAQLMHVAAKPLALAAAGNLHCPKFPAHVAGSVSVPFLTLSSGCTRASQVAKEL